ARPHRVLDRERELVALEELDLAGQAIGIARHAPAFHVVLAAPRGIDALVAVEFREDLVAELDLVEVDEIAELRLLARDPFPVPVRLDETLGREARAAILVHPQGYPQMVGRVHERRK